MGEKSVEKGQVSALKKVLKFDVRFVAVGDASPTLR